MIFKFHTSQSLIAKDKSKYRVVCCGRKFGKTTLAIYEMLGKAISENDRQIAYIAPTFTESRDIAWKEFLKIAKPSIANYNETRLEIVLNTQDGGKSTIYFKSWETAASLRGMQFDLIVFDEVAQYKEFWPTWTEDLEPTLLPRNGDALFISTPLGFNHFFDLFNRQETDKTYKSFRFKSEDNPHLNKEWLEEKRKNTPPDSWEQEYEASFKKRTGLVYKEFNRDLHVTTEDPKTCIETICGIDFGYTNPACILPIRIDRDSHFWIREEWYKSGNTVEQLIEQARLYKSSKVYPDPANAESCAKLSRAGLNVREVSKDIVAGVDHLRELFKQGRIHIHPDCKNLIYELETYRYPDKKPEQNEQEKPVKDNDHALDALRYALYTNKPIIKKHDPTFDTFGTHFVA